MIIPDSRDETPGLLVPGSEPVETVESYNNDAIIFYLFNEQSDLLSGSVGTLLGGAKFVSSGLETDGDGDGLNFDSVTAELMNFRTNDFTIFVSFRFDTQTNSFPTLISHGDVGDGDWFFRFTSSATSLNFYGDQGDTNCSASVSMSTGNHYTAVATRKGSTFRILLFDARGALESSGSQSGIASNFDSTPDGGSGFGHAKQNSITWFAGAFYSAMILSRGMTDDEISVAINDMFADLRPR